MWVGKHVGGRICENSAPLDSTADMELFRPRWQRPLLWGTALVVALSRLVAVSRSLWDWDEALFCLAIGEYDVTQHHPHPPGFPLYVAMAVAFVRPPFRLGIPGLYLPDREIVTIMNERELPLAGDHSRGKGDDRRDLGLSLVKLRSFSRGANPS